MKTKYKNILNSLQEDVKPTTRGEFEKVLLIDGMNLFYRNFCVINSLNSENNHIGGVGGFLRSLSLLIRTNRPTKVFVIFDGENHTNNRKNIVAEYKENRVKRKILNKNIHSSIKEDLASQYSQLIKVMEYLDLFPVVSIMEDGFEADDIIALTAKYLDIKHNSKCLIVSSDQDFLQLCSTNITVYRPMEKKYYKPEDVINKFNCLPENFLLYKILMGDSSDNIKKIKGLGSGKFKKYFKFLKEQKTNFEELIKYCGDRIDDHNIFAQIILNEDDLIRYSKVMDLNTILTSDKQIEIIKNKIYTHSKVLNRIEIKNKIKKDGLNKLIPDPDSWIEDTFNYFRNIENKT